MRENNFNFEEGEVLLIDKPYKWTSFDVVNKVRWLLKNKLKYKKIKVGHAGTLDPLASGLLIICTGKFTKRIEEFQAWQKEYTGTIVLGSTTPSYDLETPVNAEFGTEHITEDLIHKATRDFLGEIDQVPPLFSAKWIDGERAYEKARRGEEVEVKPNKVTIFEFEITQVRFPELDFRIKCSKGTYIRSVAHDFGKALNSGAHLSALCRTKIGSYLLDQSMQIQEFETKVKEMSPLSP